MGASSKLFLEERQRHIIEVPDSFYQEHFDLFKYPKTRHIRTIVTADEEMFSEDETHAKLVADYVKANKRLQNYKYDKRNNFKK